MTDQAPSQTLMYETPGAGQRGRNPLVAMALCFPGLCCWVFLVSIVGRHVPRGLVKPWVLPALWCWGIAIVTAIASLVLYLKNPRPWFVWVNLVINVLGLLFTGTIALLLVGH